MATKSVSIDDRFITYINEHKINLSHWVNAKMKEEFLSKEARIKELQKVIAEAQKEITLINNEDARKLEMLKERVGILTQKEKEELTESKTIIDKDLSYFEGRLSRYKHLFDKHITGQEFKMLLNNIEK